MSKNVYDTLYIPKELAVSRIATHIFLTTIPTKVKMRKIRFIRMQSTSSMI
jgi:hypothetical protein